MTLLIDQNLSPRLTADLSDAFPDLVHVRGVGLQSATDEAIWGYAKAQGLTILSKDSDFRHWSFLFGHSPKVVWISLGNCTTRQIEVLLRTRQEAINEFIQDESASFLAL
jgi:predicted nuclease of predicted toxin-antitoxin system